MVDVARVAGVALSTVSRVVNGDPGARLNTVSKVQAAIRELGWEPDERARQLRKGETDTLGAATRDISGPFSRSVERAARADGLMLLAASTSPVEADEANVIRSLCRRRVDGLVVEPVGNHHQYLAHEIANGLPVVAIDRPLPGISSDTVLSDNRGGISLAYSHLKAQGHERIAYIGDSEKIFTGKVRAATFRRFAGADYRRWTRTPGTDRVGVRRSAEELLSDPLPPTAVITGNNLITTELLLHLGPELAGLALVGYDDVDWAELIRPALTVIAQDYQAIGQAAVDLLCARRADPGRSQVTITVPVSLIARGSGERRPIVQRHRS